MTTMTTGVKAIVVIWEHPDQYFQRTTPTVMWQEEDLDDHYPAGWHRPKDDIYKQILKWWQDRVDNPIHSLLPLWGDPVLIISVGSPAKDKNKTQGVPRVVRNNP